MNQVEESKIKLIIDGDDAERSLAGLRQEAREITAEMRRMKEAGEENTDAYRQLAEQKKQLNVETREYLQNLDLENASINELRARKRLLNGELKDLKVNSDDWLDKMKEVADVDQRLDAVNAEMRALKEHTDDNVSVWSRLKDTFLGTFAAFALDDIIQEVVQFGRESVQAAAETSDAFADIAKSTQMTTDEVAALDAQIRQIDTRTAQAELLEIAKVGGQINIAKDEMLGFVRATDQAVVALGDEFSGGVEEVTSKLGTMKNLFQETKELDAGTAISKIGSALNELGSAGTATAPVVADFTTRMGQLGDLSPQISQTLGLGAAFQELGLSAEISAGGLSNILLTAAKDTATFARQLGLTEGEMKKLINTNPNEFLLKLAESLRGLPADQVAKQLSDLGIKSQEATKVMSLLKDQTQLVRDKQLLANTAMKDGTSLTKEFEIKNQTAAAQLAKFGKEVQSASVDLGNKLLPVVLKGGEYALTFGKAIGALPGFLNENKVSIGLLAAALITFNAQAILAEANSLRLAAAEKIRTIATEGAAIAQRLLNVAMSANPIGAVIAILLTLGAALVAAYQHSETFRAGVNGLWQAMKTAADVAIQFVKAFVTMDIKGIADAMMNGGKKVADAFSTTYQATLKAGHAKTEADHQTHVDKKATASKTGAEKAAKDAQLANKTGLNQITLDNAGFLSEDAKKRQEHEKQRAEEKKKANQDAIDAARKASIEAIADEKERKIAQLRFETDQQKQRIAESQADHKLKLAQFTAAESAYETRKAQIEKEYRDKKEKEDRETAEKQQKLLISLIADEHERKLAELTFQAAQARAEVERTITDGKRKADALDQINKKLSADIQKENEDHRQQELKKGQEKRDKELAADKQLFDLQFQAAVANADVNLNLAKNNAQAIYDAKKQRLDAEYQYNRQKLQNEAAEEKAKNAELIADHDKRAAADKAIDDRLKAQLTANDQKYEADKTTLTQERTAQRLANQQQFFNAVDGLMKGDYTSFMTLLNQKLANEQAKNQKALQDFTAKGQETLQVAGQAVAALQQLNQKYLESQLKKIEKEKESQLKSWKDQYDKGKISKEQYEKTVAKINADAAEKEKQEKLKAWKRDQAMQIAMALINAAMAALKSLATMGFPLGLIGVAASAAMGAIQIGIIKSQKPPSFAQGGYLRNGGVPNGPGHGNTYGQSGIALVRRDSGQEVGEMEGGEPIMILSRNTYRNNRPIIDKLLNSSLHRNGAPIMARSGAVFGDGGDYRSYLEPLQGGRMYLFGSKKAKKAAKEAEEEAQRMAAEAEAESASYDTGGYDAGDYGGGGDMEGVDGDAAGAVSMTNAEIGKSQQMMTAIAKNTEDTVEMLSSTNATLVGLANQLSTANGYLDRIAAKELSVSVHNVVNVMNSINVVNNDSNLK
jgi:hypothetical protein